MQRTYIQQHTQVWFPTMGTCRESGVQATDCSQDCLFECRTPMCSMSCLCACDTAQGKAKLTSVLKAQQASMHREMKLLAVQASMWHVVQAAEHAPAFKAHAKHRIHSLMMKNANARAEQQAPTRARAEQKAPKSARAEQKARQQKIARKQYVARQPTAEEVYRHECCTCVVCVLLCV